MLSDSIIDLRSVSKSFKTKSGIVSVFQDISLSISEGSFVVLRGSSGSGKSTFINMLAGFEKPDKGEIFVCGENVALLSGKRKENFLSHTIGIVYQQYFLQNHLNVYSNLISVLKLKGFPKEESDKKVQDLLDKVNISDISNRYPSQLSGGQMQRVAIVRSLLSSPKIILADEPTGNLDPENARQIIDLFHSIQEDFKTTIVLITHDQSLAREGDLVFMIENKSIIPYERTNK